MCRGPVTAMLGPMKNRHEKGPRGPRKARGLGWLAVPLVLAITGVTSCSGLGYTLGSLLRTSRDYDELDAERAAAQAATLAAVSRARNPYGDPSRATRMRRTVGSSLVIDFL